MNLPAERSVAEEVGHEVQHTCGQVALGSEGILCQGSSRRSIAHISWDRLASNRCTVGGPTFTHRDLRMILSGYVGDFKMVGSETNMMQRLGH